MKKNVYITKSLCCTVIINIVNQVYFNKKKKKRGITCELKIITIVINIY